MTTSSQSQVQKLWQEIGLPVSNRVKVYLLEVYPDELLMHIMPRLDYVVFKYAKYLPYFVAESERDDLKTIASLEYLETIKVWDPSKNDSIWPLARARIIGAMKDHIRHVTKSDPTRFYDWINEAAQMYMAVNDRGDMQHEIETGVELNRAMKALTDRERKIVIAHTKKDMTFKQIGEIISVSESQVSRIYKKSIEKLQKELRGKR